MLSTRAQLFWKLGLAVTSLCLFLLVPTSLLDSGPTICLIKNIFGVKCPGCGMLRAISSIFHGEFLLAFHYNKFIIIVFPLLGYIFLKTMFGEVRKITNAKNQTSPHRIKS